MGLRCLPLDIVDIDRTLPAAQISFVVAAAVAVVVVVAVAAGLAAELFVLRSEVSESEDASAVLSLSRST